MVVSNSMGKSHNITLLYITTMHKKTFASVQVSVVCRRSKLIGLSEQGGVLNCNDKVMYPFCSFILANKGFATDASSMHEETLVMFLMY